MTRDQELDYLNKIEELEKEVSEFQELIKKYMEFDGMWIARMKELSLSNQRLTHLLNKEEFLRMSSPEDPPHTGLSQQSP